MKKIRRIIGFLSQPEQIRIKAKIAGAGSVTSAEIKVVIIRRSWTDIRKKANDIFKKYKLNKPAQRNCVLILVITQNREFLIYGDQGIHEKVGQEFWEETRDSILSEFNIQEYGKGLCAGIHLIGTRLAEVFPHRSGDQNEKSDEVVNE